MHSPTTQLSSRWRLTKGTSNLKASRPSTAGGKIRSAGRGKSRRSGADIFGYLDSFAEPVSQTGARPLPYRFHSQASVWQWRSEEHTSELQSRGHLVCRLLLEKKKTKTTRSTMKTSKEDIC